MTPRFVIGHTPERGYFVWDRESPEGRPRRVSGFYKTRGKAAGTAAMLEYGHRFPGWEHKLWTPAVSHADD